jgi:hypothetical protein
LATQFAEKMIVCMESNEMAIDIAIEGGGLEIREHALCVMLEF